MTKEPIDAGLIVYGVDASPTFVEAFRRRLPGVPIECNSVEQSGFFGREFDAVMAWGLIFLLPAAVQERLIRKVARAVRKAGEFLFTAPPVAASGWTRRPVSDRSRWEGRDTVVS